jgi:hypothetical protein
VSSSSTHQCKIFKSENQCKLPNYSELFGNNLEEKVKISREMKRIGEVRNVLLAAQE